MAMPQGVASAIAEPVAGAPEMLDRLRERLSPYEFAWYGPRAVDAVGMHMLLPLKAILCCDHGQDTELIARRTGATVLALEPFHGIREDWNSLTLNLLLEPPFDGQIDAYLASRREVLHVVPFGSTRGLERFCDARKDKLRMLVSPPELKLRLDDKLRFRAAIQAMGIAPTEGEVVGLAEADFGPLADRYGLPLVVQPPIGSGGTTTRLVSAEAKFERLKAVGDGGPVVVARYVNGRVVNINAVILQGRVVLSYPSVQLVGRPECVGNPAAYCGNDFGAMGRLPAGILRQVIEQTRTIGEWVRAEGFRGLFGFDFIVDGDTVHPLEINPRFQGSTPLLTQLELIAGRVPTVMLHPLEFVGGELGEAVAELPPPAPLRGSHMVLFSREPEITMVRGRLAPGIYRLAGGRLERVRDGISLFECRGLGEVAITSAVPLPRTRVKPAGVLMRIQTFEEILDVATGALNPWAAEVARLAYRALDLA